MAKAKLFIVLVVYNELITDIDFLKRYHCDNRFHLIIIDNSIDNRISDENRFKSSEWSLEYHSENKNLGLSKAYNLGISTVSNVEENWIMTLDQDTYISEMYIQNVLWSIQNKPENLVKTGLIYFGNRIGSPTMINSREVVTEEKVYQGIDAINSGLVLNRKLLADIHGYDERLFLDMVDYLLFYNIRMFGVKNIEVLSGEISQEFSGETKTSYKNEKHRYSIYKKDYMEYSKITKQNKLKSLVVLVRRRVHLFSKYKLGK